MQTLDYRPRDLMRRLAEVRGKPVPDRTLRYWRRALKIRPDEHGRYSEEDFQILKALVFALSDGYTIAEFKAQLIERLN